MLVDRPDAPKKIRYPKGRIVWCILFTTLRDIQKNVSEKVVGDLRSAIVKRIHNIDSSLLCFWDGDGLLISPQCQIDDWRVAHEVAITLLDKFRFQLDARTERNSQITIEQDIFLTPAIGLADIESSDIDTAFCNARVAAERVAGDTGRLVACHQDIDNSVHSTDQTFFLHQAFIQSLREKTFQLAYQPKVELETGLLYGFEALLRPPLDKSSPLQGFSPTMLVDLAIATNTLTELTVFVIETALFQVGQWRHLNSKVPFSISVNVIPHTLLDGWDAIVGAVTSVESKGLVLELLETFDDYSDSSTVLVERLEMLRSMGVEISIDDFGKGMSNIDRLSSIPCDEIKLDKSLIQGITDNEAHAGLVTSVINFASHRGIRVVAEGIENNDQWRFLSETNCQIGQGYFISRPLPADQVYMLLKRLADDRLSSSF